MNADRKKPGVAFWATVVVVVVVLYVASYGPAYCIALKSIVAENLKTARLITRVFAPMFWLEKNAPAAIGSPVRSYRNWWIDVTFEDGD